MLSAISFSCLLFSGAGLQFCSGSNTRTYIHSRDLSCCSNSTYVNMALCVLHWATYCPPRLTAACCGELMKVTKRPLQTFLNIRGPADRMLPHYNQDLFSFAAKNAVQKENSFKQIKEIFELVHLCCRMRYLFSEGIAAAAVCCMQTLSSIKCDCLPLSASYPAFTPPVLAVCHQYKLPFYAQFHRVLDLVYSQPSVRSWWRKAQYTISTQ